MAKAWCAGNKSVEQLVDKDEGGVDDADCNESVRWGSTAAAKIIDEVLQGDLIGNKVFIFC